MQLNKTDFVDTEFKTTQLLGSLKIQRYLVYLLN